MKIVRLLAVCLCAMLAGIGTAQAVVAVLPKPSIVAIVDVQRILQDSLAAKSVQQQIETLRSKFQSEVSGEEKDLRAAEKKLAKTREGAQSAAAYADQEQQLRQRFLVVERHVQARRKALDQAFTDSMNAVRKGIVDIVAAVAQERGVNLAIVKQQVIWNDSAIDITDEVLGRLNKKFPHLEVKVVADSEESGDKGLILKGTGPRTGKK